MCAALACAASLSWTVLYELYNTIQIKYLFILNPNTSDRETSMDIEMVAINAIELVNKLNTFYARFEGDTRD